MFAIADRHSCSVWARMWRQPRTGQRCMQNGITATQPQSVHPSSLPLQQLHHALYQTQSLSNQCQLDASTGMSIGRFSNSVVSGTNENTLALVNFNVDFSLLKLDAPQEFAGLGTVLTRQRRELAEDGPVHRTARRLGALFESIVPNSPTLIRAYGSRVSEISQEIAKSDTLRRHGVFAECAGVDGTSVWAAATSGKSALSLHLLACMLARSWSGPEATSIWVEIVEQRRKFLSKQIDDGLYDSSAQLGLAISQDITRSDLAHWDASTRAWLQVADDSQIRRQKQLMLIINNINIPVNQGDGQITTYSRVIEAWKNSAEALERLFNGQSQCVSNGAVLLGLASWHLYPRLLVLGEKISEIDFKDNIVESSGQLTVGLQSPDANEDRGVYWSLSLAHLRFYGDPVQVTSFTTTDASRLNMKEFHLLVMGSILSDWGSLHPTEYDDAAKFFVALNASVSAGYKRLCEYEKLRAIAISKGQIYLDWKWSWIKLLGFAGAEFLSLKGSEKTIATSIMALGHRRGDKLLSPGNFRHPPPYLGLNHPWFQYMLSEPLGGDFQNSIEMMRYLARKLGLNHDQCLIKNEESGEYMTAIPHKECTGPESYIQLYHVSWHKCEIDPCLCAFQGRPCYTTKCPCVSNDRICTHKCHPDDGDRYRCEEQALPSAARTPNSNDMNAHPSQIRTFHYHPEQFSAPWNSAIDVTAQGATSSRSVLHKRPTQYHSSHKHPLNRRLCSCHFKGWTKSIFTRITGGEGAVGLYVRSNDHSDRKELQKALKHARRERLSPVKKIIERLETEAISPIALVQFLESIYREGRIDMPNPARILDLTTFHVKNYLNSLAAVSLATEAYDNLPGSTISIQLISFPLHDAKWMPDHPVRTLTRQQKFSCIAMLESGSYNVEPAELLDVIAISSRNSIFVSNILLEDPYSVDQFESITRVIGNVGKTGIVFMVVPTTPRLRKIELGEYRLITHAPFDGKLDNCFQATSLHLRFTEFEMPFNIGPRGAIDQDLRMIETLVQVFDRDTWVADLDILLLFNYRSYNLIRRNKIECAGCDSAGSIPRPLRSLDNWEELLETGHLLGTLEVGVLRAHNNWLARLAAACVSVQKGYRTVINPPRSICWHCSLRKEWTWTSEAAPNGKSKLSPNKDAGSDLEVDSDASDEIWADSVEQIQNSSADPEDPTDPQNYLEAVHPVMWPNEDDYEGSTDDSLSDYESAEGVSDVNEATSVDDDDPGYSSDESTMFFSDHDEVETPNILPQIFIV